MWNYVKNFQHNGNGAVNSLPNNKILDLSKFKALADDKINVIQNTEILFGMVRKHCGKRKKKSW